MNAFEMQIEINDRDWRANARCPDEWVAARTLCGCRGSGHLPEWVALNYGLAEYAEY